MVHRTISFATANRPHGEMSQRDVCRRQTRAV